MTHNKYILKGGSILGQRQSDILIQDGVITQIADGIQDENARVFSLEHQIVLPGLVDLHTHG